MEPPPKRRRANWSEDNLRSAMEDVANGQLSVRASAVKYNIPRRTLRNHIKTGSTKKKLGRGTILTEDQEKDFVSRIIRFAEIGMPLTPKVIRKQVFIFCKKQGIKHYFNDFKCIAGKVWLKKFLERHPELAKRKAQFINPARAQKLNKPIVRQHFQAIKELYDELDITNHPERLYNVDEKGCRLTLHHQQKVLAQKGARRVHLIAQEHGQNVTITMCVNAIGNSIPPMVIFKGKRMRPEFLDNLPAGSLVKMAPKGTMTTDLFIDFIEHLAKYKSPGRCLLVFDGASSHLDFQIVAAADKADIVLYCLPSNTTHELQPLDKSVNKSFEHHWDDELLIYLYQHPNRNITKGRFNTILSKVWPKCMTQNNIKNGFRATGLLPYDPYAIPEEAYAPSVLTELPNPQPSTSRTERHSPQSVTSEFNRANLNSQSGRCDESDTDFEDDQSNLSPSLLSALPDEQNPGTSKGIVDYSSSSGSDVIAEENIEQILKEVHSSVVRYSTPPPGTSRGSTATNIQRPIIFSSPSDISDSEIVSLSHHIPKNFKIYSSESDEENVNPCTNINKSNLASACSSADSEDNIPLINLKKNKNASGITKSPFQEFLPTPNYAIVKNKPRRKALNFKGQRITKNLFKETEYKSEKVNPKKATKVISKKFNQEKKKTKATEKMIQKRKTHKCMKKSNKVIKQMKTNRLIKQKPINQNKNSNDVWYCYGCHTERVADMQQCIDCRKWYHEECVGLTEEDYGQFTCPDCE